MEENSGSPSSRDLCVGLGPKPFFKEIPIPASRYGPLPSVSLVAQVPVRPLSVNKRVSVSLPAGSAFNYEHIGILPLVRNKNIFHFY